ncbi:patatin-like phospholipase family protein [Lentibacillus sp. Marseille-P4043]|uniref:patatin-like phospholipase family protein n=1 Tax=Lentibacillus sp. Marseille-P4043 TaxID=2040293 RepID=UPI000D0BC4DA|nr:patatin-like phospholipase family protein [Lentibacillus sp. Marseille-P4043]
MKIDVVFSGGGVKAYAFLGALTSIEEHKHELERVAGTSAGAIVAAFLAAGYRLGEIEQLMNELDLKKFLDQPAISNYIPFSKWLFFYFQMGLYKGDKLENWLYECLAEKDVYTFNDVKPGYLKVVVSDLSLGKLVVIPDDIERIYGINPKHFPVAKAIRMSAGFPYFFMPKKLPGKTKDKSIIVDGGLLSNFPLWIFENGDTIKKRPVLGVKLSANIKDYQPRKIRNAFDMFHALFSTMKQAHDSRYISKSQKNNIIFIPVENVETTNFSISEQTKTNLIEAGKNRAEKFLRNWPK